MRKNPRPVLIGAFVFILLTSGCGAVARANPTPVWTAPVTGQTLAPATALGAAPTLTQVSITPLIPITGEDVVSMQCQFCVDAETHTILVFPDFAYFDVSSDASVSCLTADVVNGRRILICRGTQSTTFTLNICSDPENCLQYPVALQPCPVLQAGATPLVTNTPFAPVFLTPINTLKAPMDGPTQPGSTAAPSSTPTATLRAIAATPTLAPVTPTFPFPTLPFPTTSLPSMPTLETTPLPPLLPTDTSQPQPSNTPEPVVPTQSSGSGGDTFLVICHVSPGNASERKTMTISQTDWSGHRKHGDSLGPCS